MKKLWWILCWIGVSQGAVAQETGGFTPDTLTVKKVDSLFREDQFYVSLGYNLVQNSPRGFKRFSFSPTITVGFLRDFPISKNRHWAIAPGVGYSFNSIKQYVSTKDLFPDDPDMTAANVKTNIASHSIELPLEIRWRNANPESHKFWRIYGGFKARYILSSKMKVEFDGTTSSDNLKNVINKWQYGIYMAAGYNTWNPYVYYGLNPIFKNGSKLKDLNIGFMFYIL